MKCDKLNEKIQITNDTRMVYLKSEVDAAIAELKEVYKDSVDVKVKIWERYKKAEDELRDTKRALWMARANRAEARKNYWYVRSIHESDKDLWSIDGSAVKYIGCIKRSNFDWLKIWSEVECKCLAKAKEYK